MFSGYIGILFSYTICNSIWLDRVKIYFWCIYRWQGWFRLIIDIHNYFHPKYHWRQCLMTCSAVSEGRGCRFLPILCSRMYVSLGLCSNMLLIKCYVDYLFYYFSFFSFLGFTLPNHLYFLCLPAVLQYFYMFACPFIMLCFICLYTFLSICLYIVSDDENKDDQSINILLAAINFIDAWKYQRYLYFFEAILSYAFPCLSYYSA